MELLHWNREGLAEEGGLYQAREECRESGETVWQSSVILQHRLEELNSIKVCVVLNISLTQ